MLLDLCFNLILLLIKVKFYKELTFIFSFTTCYQGWLNVAFTNSVSVGRRSWRQSSQVKN